MPNALPTYSERFFELGSGGRNTIIAPIYYADDYANSDVKFPPYFNGKPIIGEFIRNWLQVINTDSEGNIETIVPLLDAPFSAPLDMAFGPDGALYLVEYGTTWFTQNPDAYLSRIEYYAGDNPPPVAIASVSKAVGAAPLETILDASASYDRDGDPDSMAFRWELMQNGRAVELLGEQRVQPTTFSTPGNHEVRLTVIDAKGAETSTGVLVQVGNERPLVEISVAGNRSFYWEEHPLAYKVNVTDLEDGSTGDGLISGVTVKSAYAATEEEMNSVLAEQSIDPLLAGKAMVESGSDCHACHQLDSDSVGPSLTAIAKRYAGESDAKTYLVQVISEGISGQWGGTHAMPAHPALTEQQLDQASLYILSLAQTGAGLSTNDSLAGVINFEKHQNDFQSGKIDVSGITSTTGPFYSGRYMLQASYTDEGGKVIGPLQGTDELVLRHPRIPGGAFDVFNGAMAFDLGDGAVTGIFATPSKDSEFAYGKLTAIDLTNVSKIKLAVTAIRPIFSGGRLELRLGSSDAQAMGWIDVEAGFIPDLENAEYFLDVSAVTGQHDLYIGVPAREDSSEEATHLVLSLEFLR